MRSLRSPASRTSLRTPDPAASAIAAVVPTGRGPGSPPAGWLASGGPSLAWLTQQERARAESFADAGDRRDYLTAHLLVRQLAARLAGISPADVVMIQRCQRCGGPHGRPVIAGHPGLHVSLAHTRGAVIAAAAASPVGADIETLRRPRFDLTLADTLLTRPEQRAVRQAADPHRAFLRHWVRKEAAVKVGLGRLGRLAEIDLGHLPVSGVPDDAPVAAPLGPAWPGMRLLDQVDGQNEIALAVISSQPVRLIAGLAH